MKLETCLFCGTELEDTSRYGPERNETIAPRKIPLCYVCLNEMKKALKTLDEMKTCITCGNRTGVLCKVKGRVIPYKERYSYTCEDWVNS